VDCLDIADIQRRTSTEGVTWQAFFNFLETVGRIGIWQAVCMDNLGERDLTDWAKRHGWTDRQEGTPDFCYINFYDEDAGRLYGINRNPDTFGTRIVFELDAPNGPLAIEGAPANPGPANFSTAA
jgi:hypothetical protein